jgi:hypothetical protein
MTSARIRRVGLAAAASAALLAGPAVGAAAALDAPAKAPIASTGTHTRDWCRWGHCDHGGFHHGGGWWFHNRHHHNWWWNNWDWD